VNVGFMAIEVNVEELVVRGNIEKLAESGYGSRCGDKCLKLSPYEALYLFIKGKIALKRGDKRLDLRDALKLLSNKTQNLWLGFTVYANLRDRGYIVKKGFTDAEVEFRVYERGDKPGLKPAKYIVRVISEGRVLSVREMLDMIQYARRLRKELILAIVDANGGVTYYSANQVEV